jgi:hypothetical protein
MTQHELTDVPVIAEVDPKNRVSYEMTVTPQTILIDSDGKVEKVWTGFIQGDERGPLATLLLRQQLSRVAAGVELQSNERTRRTESDRPRRRWTRLNDMSQTPSAFWNDPQSFLSLEGKHCRRNSGMVPLTRCSRDM